MAEARPAGRVGDVGPTIVHVEGHIPRDDTASRLGRFESFLHGVYHPYLADTHHERQTNGATVVGGVVAPIVDEI